MQAAEPNGPAASETVQAVRGKSACGHFPDTGGGLGDRSSPTAARYSGATRVVGGPDRRTSEARLRVLRRCGTPTEGPPVQCSEDRRSVPLQKATGGRRCRVGEG